MKKQLMLGGIAALLLISAGLLLFRDRIFSPGPAPAISDPKTAAAVADAAAAVAPADQQVAPNPPNPPPRGSGKKAGGM